jgi:hypothetical protein
MTSRHWTRTALWLCGSVVWLAVGTVPGALASQDVVITFGEGAFVVANQSQKELGAIAGLSGQHTRWFNGQTLFFEPSTPGSVFVYAAYRDLLVSPWSLERVGDIVDTYTFTDPNGANWTSARREYDYDGDGKFHKTETIFRVPIGDVRTDPSQGDYNFALIVNAKESPDVTVFTANHGGPP